MRTLGFASSPDLALAATDNFSVQIEFADGGVGTASYAADSPTGPGKERFETSAPGVYAEIDDFRQGEIWAGAARTGGREPAAGQGIRGAVREGCRGPSRRGRATRCGGFFVATLATLAAARSLETGKPEVVFEPAAPTPTPEATAQAEAAS